MLGGQMCLSCDISISENFFAGPIPVLITFSIGMSAAISLSCGIYSLQDKSNPDEKFLDAALDFTRWKFDYANTGLTITINITPSLSVGVGIRDVASISVMGRFTLTMYTGFTYRGELDEDTHPLPHYLFGFSAQIGLVPHLFLFTKTFSLKNWKYRDFYDNWKGGLQPWQTSLRATRVAEPGLAPLADNPTSVLPDPKVQGLGREGGIRPSSDIVIAPKVFGDPRVKVVNLSLLPPATGDDYIRATCSFRIGSVLVNGQPRTRIVMTFLAVSGEGLVRYPAYYDLVGTSKVLDFNINDVPGVSHKDLYDYDFDLVFTKRLVARAGKAWRVSRGRPYPQRGDR